MKIESVSLPSSHPPDAAGHLIRGGLPGKTIDHLSVGEGHLNWDATVRGPLGHQGIVLSFELLVQTKTLVDVLRRWRQLSRKEKTSGFKLWRISTSHVCMHSLHLTKPVKNKSEITKP